MIAHTRHSRSMSCCAALLLVLQALGAPAVSLAHATERTTAPAGWEARHTASCPILHDAARCAVCHYAGARFVATSTVVPPAAAPRSCCTPPDPGLRPPSSPELCRRRVAAADPTHWLAWAGHSLNRR